MFTGGGFGKLLGEVCMAISVFSTILTLGLFDLISRIIGFSAVITGVSDSYDFMVRVNYIGFTFFRLKMVISGSVLSKYYLFSKLLFTIWY